MRPFDTFVSERHRRLLSMSASVSILTLVLVAELNGAAALAQASQGSAVDRPSPAQARNNDDDSNAIVVTARRKEESLTDVPASITAYSSDFFKKQNIQTFADYATKLPNVTFQYGQGGDFSSVGFVGGRQTTIRGVAGANTTAYYINDTPVPASISPQTLDLDRIEVLKGPQGTLFGASSMGGNLRFITRQPTFTENSYTAQIQGGGTKNGGFDFDGNALANLVVVPDRVGLDIAGGYTRESGFITRRFPGASGALVSVPGQGRGDTYSASASLRAKLTDELEATISGIGQIYNLHGFPAAYLPLPGYRPVTYTIDRDRDVQEYSKDRWGLGSLVLKYSGEGYSIVSSSSYFARRTKELEDTTEGNNGYIRDVLGVDIGDPPLPTINISKDRRFTQEVRLSFDDGTLLPGLSGIVGFFYQHRFNSFAQPALPVPEFEDAGFDPPFITRQTFPTHEDNSAIFGELYYEILPKLTLTGGLRQYWIKQKADAMLSEGIFNSPGGDLAPARRSRQSGIVPKFVVSYKLPREGTVYASASKGFRLGGSQGRLPDFCQSDLAAIGRTQDDTQDFKSDTLWSYEVGAKSRIAGGRLNVAAAAFQIDWSNIQQQVILPTCTFSFTANAGKARIRGGELEVSGRPIAGVPLMLQLGLGYTDGRLLDPGLLAQAPDTRLVQTPRWTGSISGNYDHPISDNASLLISADYSYTGGLKVANSAGGFLDRKPLNFVNASIGVKFGTSQITLYGKNLLDKRLNLGDLYSSGIERSEILADGSAQRLPRGAVSRPRQIGVQFRTDF